MTKPKGKSSNLCAQPEPEDREIEEDHSEPRWVWEEAIEGEQEEYRLRDRCAAQAAAVLRDLARVPSAGREQFREEISDLVYESIEDWCHRGAKLSKAYLDLERSIRAAYVATNKLTKGEMDYLEHAMQEQWRSMARPNSRAGRAISLMIGALGWRHTLSGMVKTCTRLTGKNPYPNGSRGRRSGDITDYPLRSFITGLAVTFMDTGGHLTLDVKGQRGTWVEALNMLRPLLPKGFIPIAPPLSTIERWIRKAEKPPL
jgi:hypothetical protein